MVDRLRKIARRKKTGGCSMPPARFVFLLSVISGLGMTSVKAQTPSAAAYPTDPAAAAGMTRGGSTSMSAREIELMQVRTAAQGAQGDAVAASMSRSADRSLDDQNNARALQSAREEKAIKAQMRERMKWDQVNSRANVRKVSTSDMATWKTDSGGVRVERNVPDPFIASLIEEERQLAAREAAEKNKKGGLFSWRPFSGGGGAAPPPVQTQVAPQPATQATTQASLPASDSGGGGGFFSNLRGSRRSAETYANPAAAEPQFVNTSSSSSSPPAPRPTNATVTKPGTVPRISGAALVDGRSSVNQGQAQAASSGQTVSAPQPGQTYGAPQALPPESSERSGFFSKKKSNSSDSVPSRSSGGGGLFSFGKKASKKDGPSIDAGLFPSNSVAQAPTGGNLQSEFTSQDVADDMAAAPSSTGNIELPGEGNVKRSKGFSLPKPKLSVPSFGRGGSSGGGGGSVPTMSTINSAGTDFYVVTSAAQFMIYGNDQMQSEVRALPAGMVVQMTKPGENWASVRLSNGTQGILENKNLRAATTSEASTQFTFSN